MSDIVYPKEVKVMYQFDNWNGCPGRWYFYLQDEKTGKTVLWGQTGGGSRGVFCSQEKYDASENDEVYTFDVWDRQPSYSLSECILQAYEEFLASLSDAS